MVSFALSTRPGRDRVCARIRELRPYLRRSNTAEGRATIHKAMVLARSHPHLSAPELLRLAYWGAQHSLRQLDRMQ